MRSSLVSRIVNFPTLESLKIREFRLLWLGQAGNAMGMWMDQIARGWLIYELTDSALQLGLITIIRAVPLLLLSPVAGSLADRYDRKLQIIAAQLIDGVLFALMAFLIFSGLVEPWHVYATGIGTSLVSVFQQPARQAMVMQVVDRKRLTNAIGLDSMILNVSRSTGPALAGILIALVGAGGSYVAQSVLFFLATFWTLQLRPLPPIDVDGDSPEGGREGSPPAPAHHAVRRHSIAGGTLETWRYVVGNETVRNGMLVTMLTSFLAVPFTTLLPVFAKDVLAAGSTGQGALLSAMGVGAVFSGFMIATLGSSLPRGIVMLGGAVGYGLSVIAFAASSWMPVSVIVMVIAGICNVACHALVRTIIQGHAPPAMGGRVMGLFQQTQVLQMVGGLIAGALASVWGAPWAAGSMAALCVVGAFVLYAGTNARSIR